MLNAFQNALKKECQDHLGIAHFIGTSIWDASYKSGLRTKWCGNMNAEASILSILPSLVTLVGLTLFLLRKSKMGETVDENRDEKRRIKSNVCIYE